MFGNVERLRPTTSARPKKVRAALLVPVRPAASWPSEWIAAMRAGVAAAEPQDPIVRLRRDDGTIETHDWTDPRIDLTTPLAPWRIPRWVHGQRHYSGRYWCATTTGHLLYESRLELARAIYADFDRTVNHIVAQPFQLEAKVDGKTRRYTPDYLLLTSKDPVVVEVKPRNWLTRPKVIRRTTLARQLVEQRGWQYEVWSEPPPAEFVNLKFLAGYRNKRLFDEKVAAALSDREVDGRTFEEVCRNENRWSQPIVRSHLLHLMWTGRIITDIEIPLSPKSLLNKRIKQ
ncbi:MAG: TnsA-like heteromeric transposase endonuclease subunit [Mycobacterium sp.]|nr:TnsA-like heteromeric transposase endonuclease subunit [Mycobacterium sp.]MDR3663543.1 TnsA-like heteromeric transposase endonuclease subunit [Mycobacterium sp.]